MSKTYYHVIDRETGQCVHTVETEHTGRMKDRMETGLYRKVDFDRFNVVESKDSEPPNPDDED